MSIWVALGSLLGAIWGHFLTLLGPKGAFETKIEGSKTWSEKQSKTGSTVKGVSSTSGSLITSKQPTPEPGIETEVGPGHALRACGTVADIY